MRITICCALAALFVFSGIGLSSAVEPEQGKVIEKAELLAPDPVAPAPAPTSTISLLSEGPAPMPVVEEVTLAGEDDPAVSVGCGGATGCGTGCGEGCSSCGAGCGSCCRGCGLGPCCCCSTCNMGQHHMYFPPMHGYYYFRPYHHTHVRNHQMVVQTWGEDPANPYANKIFQIVYEQYEAEKGVPISPPPVTE